jgi:hypothetical protein
MWHIFSYGQTIRAPAYTSYRAQPLFTTVNFTIDFSVCCCSAAGQR